MIFIAIVAALAVYLGVQSYNRMMTLKQHQPSTLSRSLSQAQEKRLNALMPRVMAELKRSTFKKATPPEARPVTQEQGSAAAESNAPAEHFLSEITMTKGEFLRLRNATEEEDNKAGVGSTTLRVVGVKSRATRRRRIRGGADASEVVAAPSEPSITPGGSGGRRRSNRGDHDDDEEDATPVSPAPAPSLLLEAIREWTTPKKGKLEPKPGKMIESRGCVVEVDIEYVTATPAAL